MFKVLIMAAAAMFAVPAAAADTVTFNSDPSIAFNYGSGNDYTPANAAVLTTTDPTSQLAGRAHIRFAAAAPSNASGVYSFALGSDVGFDYSFANMLTGDISLYNELTGQSWTSGVFPLGNLLLQDSQPLTAAFLSSLGFDANVNDTYDVTLTGTNAGGSHTLTYYIQMGDGAVPEPATWALMLLGFGGIGMAMRRTRKMALAQIA